jgi:hypothetical protein
MKLLLTTIYRALLYYHLLQMKAESPNVHFKDEQFYSNLTLEGGF